MSRLLGGALLGVDGFAVEVEVRISSQLPCVEIVGLPEASVRESATRVRAAISGIGRTFPGRRVTVNLAPASLRKGGAGLDLPIAVGILAAEGVFESEELAHLGLLGELALDGRLRPVHGALALTLALRDAGCTRVVVPRANGAEAALAPGDEVFAAGGLGEVVSHLGEGERLQPARPVARPDGSGGHPDLVDVRGQETPKRALEIAAAGGHGMFLRGAPGCGKTMLARRLPSVLPELDFDEALEVTLIHSAAGLVSEGAPVKWLRPFRAPHHSASAAGLLGGGNPPRPGEISLAHRGVLFLDELPEFDRRSLAALRQVLEERQIVIARARHSCVFPAHFQLVAAANPCPCGWLGSEQRDCRCDEGRVARYQERISGPLIDRIDLLVAVRAVPWQQLDSSSTGDSSGEVAARIAPARTAQRRRAPPGTRAAPLNAALPDALLDTSVAATPEARQLLGRAVDRLRLSARSARRALKVARTIADLAGEPRTGPRAVAEALSFRDDGANSFSRL